VLLGQVIH